MKTSVRSCVRKWQHLKVLSTQDMVHWQVRPPLGPKDGAHPPNLQAQPRGLDQGQQRAQCALPGHQLRLRAAHRQLSTSSGFRTLMISALDSAPLSMRLFSLRS